MPLCKPPRQSSGVFNSLFIFNNQALEVGGSPVSLGVLPLSSQGQMDLFGLYIYVSDSNRCDCLDFYILHGHWSRGFGHFIIYDLKC